MAFTKIAAAGIGSTETVTLHSLEVLNNATVGGVLTYEDVTNVDSIGIVTARAGVLVGSGITLSKDGDVFFTGIATGNGSGLTALNATQLTSGTVPTARLGSGTASSSTFLRGDSTFATVTSTTINNNADNRLITGSGTANTLEAESLLTYSPNGTLNISGTGEGGPQVFRDGGSGPDITLHGSRGTIASPTASQNTDLVGNINFAGYDGSGYIRRASINAVIDGTVSDGSDTVPTAIFFKTGSTSREERMRIDSSGRLLLGHNASQTIGSNSHGLVQLNVNSNQTVLSLARFENVVAGPSLNLGKSRASSAGSYTVVQNGDGLGSISFSGADGTDLVTVGALVEAQVDGTPGSNDMPARLVFSTTKDGESSPSEAMRITSAGYVQDANLPVASLSSTFEVAISNAVLTSTNFYNVTHLNQGNHFDASTGEFTCPVHGVYRIYFRATLDNVAGNRANVRLQKNGSTINEAYCTQDTYYTNVSSEAVVLCNANDTLRIQANSLHTMSGDQHKQVTFQYLG